MCRGWASRTRLLLFGFWPERRRARCQAPGSNCIRKDTRPTEPRRRWPGVQRPAGLGASGSLVLLLARYGPFGYAPRSRLASEPNAHQQNWS